MTMRNRRVVPQSPQVPVSNTLRISRTPRTPLSRHVVNKGDVERASASVAWQTPLIMAPAPLFGILVVILGFSWSRAHTSTESPGVVHTLVASPVAAPPLEDSKTTPTPPGVGVNTSLLVSDRNAKAIRFSSLSGNEVDSVLSPEDELGVAAEVGGLSDPVAESDTNPLAAFKGIVSECLWALSVACLQRKILIFVNRLSRRDRFSLLGDGVTLVRVWGDAPAAISEDILAERVSSLASADSVSETSIVPDEENLLDALTQRALDDLLYSHAIRLRLPTWIGSYTGARSISAVDVDLDDLIESRQKKKGGIKIKIKKKKKKGGGKQMMKKMMKGMAKMGGMMMTMLLGKVAVLAPLLKIKSAIALKAATLALLLSKILLVRSLFSSGLGGGSGLSSIFSGLKGGLGGGSTPSSSYGAPSQPSSSYGAPSQPSSSYGTPQQQPSSSYGAPMSSYNPPSTSYGTPSSSSYKVPSSSYGAPSSRPSSSYGAPSSSWSSGPTAPPAAPASSYGAPAAQNSYAPPSKDYGAPSGGGGSWSSGGGFSSTGSGGGAGAGSGSSSGANSGSSSGGGGYVGGGSHWTNRRGWDSYSVEATTEIVDQYSQ